MGGEVFELGNPEWRGAQAVLEIPVEGEGGSKNCAFHHGSVDFFWNNPLRVTSMLSFSEHFPLPAMYIIIQPRTCRSFSEITRLPLQPTVPAEANLTVFLEEPEILCRLLKFGVIIDHQNCRTT